MKNRIHARPREGTNESAWGGGGERERECSAAAAKGKAGDKRSETNGGVSDAVRAYACCRRG
jgi:hypothetical protein